MDNFLYNTLGFKVLTDSGFRNFVGIAKTNENYIPLRIEFNDGSHIEVTHKHKIMAKVSSTLIDQDVQVHAQSLNIGDTVATMDGYLSVVNITPGNPTDTYELVEVGDHKYKTNNIISHNCQFLSSDPLLIDSIILGNLERGIKEPFKEDMGFKFWQEIKSDKTYLLGVDPATGSGEDFTTIQLYDFQDLTLVAEYRSNTMSSSVAYASLKLILNKITQMGSMVFFSVENNGVGEGIIALYESDEDVPENADFISEEGAKKLGMRTEKRVKLRTCLVLKQLVESGKLQVWSENLLKELRSFVTNAGSYSAQYGATDDLISSLLIIIRLLEEMATYDQRAFDKVNDYHEVGTFAEDANTNDDDMKYDEDYTPDGFLL